MRFSIHPSVTLLLFVILIVGLFTRRLSNAFVQPSPFFVRPSSTVLYQSSSTNKQQQQQPSSSSLDNNNDQTSKSKRKYRTRGGTRRRHPRGGGGSDKRRGSNMKRGVVGTSTGRRERWQSRTGNKIHLKSEMKQRALFELFHPHKKSTEILVRRQQLLNEIPNDRVITSILKSWAWSNKKDAADRCYEVFNYLRNKNPKEDECTHLTANHFTYACVINAYALRNQPMIAEGLLRELILHINHHHGSRHDMDGTTPDIAGMFHVVLSSWSRCDDMNDAPEQCERLLNEMKHISSTISGNDDDDNFHPNSMAYTIVLNTYAKRGRSQDAERILREMMNNPNVKPNVVSFSSVMSSWSRSDRDDAPEQCERLLDEMKQIASTENNNNSGMKIVLDTVSYSIVIDAYAKRGRPMEAEKILREMLNHPHDDNIKPNVVSFSSVMDAWSKSDVKDAPEQCERLLDEMKQLASSTNDDQLLPNAVSYGIVMDAYAKRGRPVEAEKVLRDMLKNNKKNSKPNVVLFSSVMDAWSRSNVDDAPEQCERLHSEMKQLALQTDNKDLLPNTVSCSILLDAYAKRGRPVEAEKVLRDMMSNCLLSLNDTGLRVMGPRPNVVSFNSVMNAWSRSDVDDAPEQCERLLEEMKELSSTSSDNSKNKQHQRIFVPPDVVSYNIVLDAYAKRGRPMEAEKFLRKMLSSEREDDGYGNSYSIKPDIVSFNTVMDAWSKVSTNTTMDENVVVDNDDDDNNAPYKQCERLLEEMKQIASKTGDKRLMPDNISYTILKEAYTKCGKTYSPPEDTQEQ